MVGTGLVLMAKHTSDIGSASDGVALLLVTVDICLDAKAEPGMEGLARSILKLKKWRVVSPGEPEQEPAVIDSICHRKSM